MSHRIAHVKLADLLTVEPRPEMIEVVRRAGTLLAGVGRPALRMVALKAGYTPQHHADGVLYYSFAARERSYGDWLDFEEHNPHCDPDNEALLGQIEELLDALSVRAAVGIAMHLPAPARDELLSVVCDERALPTRFARAKARLAALRDLGKHPFDGAPRAGAYLRREGGAMQLALATAVLDLLRLEIREAPVDPERLAYILTDVMKFERRLGRWLEAQREKFAAIASAEALDALGLGEAIPRGAPPLGHIHRFLHVAEA